MRNKIVTQAQAWIGKKESDGSHKIIIDTYNAHKPLARGYKVKYTDAWCATFVSAVAIVAGATAAIPTECSCIKMIDLLKSLGSWIEDDSYTPKAGDLLFYDWEDSGKGDNKGSADHIGIVEKVSGNTITIIEGNYKNAVSRRTLQINARYIRGYGVPKYDTAAPQPQKVEGKVMIEMNVLRKGSEGEQVKTLQRLLTALGYKMQNGKKTYGVDGSYGTATYNAVIAFQKAKKLEVDGVVGKNTWNALLKG